MSKDIKKTIEAVLDEQGLLSENQELLKCLDNSPVIRLYRAIDEKDAFGILGELSFLMQCNNDHDVRKEQHGRLGHIARQFQKSLIAFRDDLGPTFLTQVNHSGNVQSQILEVIRMTSDSAMTVLNLAEKQSRDFDLLSREVTKAISAREGSNLDDLNDEVLKKINQMSFDLEESNRHILISQSYQDLSGQILNKIKFFIDSIEGGLMEIVRMLAEDCIDEKLASIDSKKLDNNCSQDDVDDLLSSLGF